MDLGFNINDYIVDKVNNHTVELYYDENIPCKESHIFEEIIVPSPTEYFISELNTRRLILPNTIKVVDVTPYVDTDFSCNFPPSLEVLNIGYVDFVNKTFEELFSGNIRYKYEHCSLNGVPLHHIINERYEKCFGVKPKYNTTRLYNQSLNTNSINKRFHGEIIKAILTKG